MGFNSGFKGLIKYATYQFVIQRSALLK